MTTNFPVEKLKELFKRSNHEIVKIDPINFGMTAQAFDCHKKGKNLIFKISDNKRNLLKEQYAYENFNSSVIPVPKFISFGEIAPNLFYAVTEKVKGENFHEIDTEQKRNRVLPQIAKTLDQIHNISIEKNKGFGVWNAEGFAPHKSWREFILSIKNSNKYNWKKMINEKGMDRKLVEKVVAEIDHLSQYCSETRHLIHGDFGGGNLIWDGSQITGVIDWAHSKYGDFLYDIAWMEFFSVSSDGKIDYQNFFKKHYEKIDKKIENYEKRMKCYKLHIGLFLARVNLNQGRKSRYRDRWEALSKILSE